MAIQALENLSKIHKLKPEPADLAEFNGMVSAATIKLKDVEVIGLSKDSQFLLAYGAAHSLALAALRWHGYRSDSRYIVFQCLEYTLGLAKAKWRVLDKCHNSRNLAEYEGHLDVDTQLLKELKFITNELLLLVMELPSIK